MNPDHFRFLPEQASSVAGEVDLLYYCLLGFSGAIIIGISCCILYFAVRYRRTPGRVAEPVRGGMKVELIWTITPLIIALGLFSWGAKIYVYEKIPPPDAMDIYVVGRQWMWKVQHPEGRMEINELHIPAGRPIRLIMTSMDVIHSFFVPAFRTKQDVVPGMYTQEWFTPTKTGQYHLFCSQYCGTDHSKMVGWVYVMEPAKYAEWLATSASAVPLAVAGEQLFKKYGCANCHGQRAPTLAGLYGRKLKLNDGHEITADDNYIRESILYPGKQLVSGYPDIMPSFNGILTEEQVLQLVEYIKSLRRAVLPGENP